MTDQTIDAPAAGASTQDEAERPPKRQSTYVVLEKFHVADLDDRVADDAEVYVVVKRDVAGRKDTDAIARAIGRDPEQGETFAAVPRLTDRTPRVETKTRTLWS